MIFFIANGRLGNQIFQYSFLKNIQIKNEKIIVFGFDDFANVFDNNDYINVKLKPDILFFLFKIIIKKILIFLSKCRLINYIHPICEILENGYQREMGNYKKIYGVVRAITYIKTSSYHCESFFNPEIKKTLKIKEKWYQKAKKILSKLPGDLIYVHIRRGDYKNYDVFGKSSILPISYFYNAINRFINTDKNRFFIFLSDDIKYVEENFKWLKNKKIITNNYPVDFVIMTLCSDAILSPSSFGWWGSYLMEKRNMVYVPEYWLGFNSKINYPKYPIANYMTKITVEDIELQNEKNNKYY